MQEKPFAFTVKRLKRRHLCTDQISGLKNRVHAIIQGLNRIPKSRNGKFNDYAELPSIRAGAVMQKSQELRADDQSDTNRL